MKVIEWEPIKGFDGYFINELGEVKSVKSFKGTQEKILKGSKNQQGYKTISLMKNGKMYTKTLHRLLQISKVNESKYINEDLNFEPIDADVIIIDDDYEKSIKNIKWK